MISGLTNMGIAVVLYECTPWEYEILQKKAS